MGEMFQEKFGNSRDVVYEQTSRELELERKRCGGSAEGMSMHKSLCGLDFRE